MSRPDIASIASIAGLLLVALLCGSGPVRADAATRTGFDHPGHARALARAGGATAAPLSCERCHTQKAGQLVRRPDHAACFGECHGAAPTRQEAAPAGMRPAAAAGPATAPPSPAAGPATAPPPPAAASPADEQAALRARTCGACHAAAELSARRFTVAYPPYTIAPDWPATMSHLAHREVGCLRCHTVPPPPRAAAPAARPAAAPPAAAAAAAPPHRRCLGCHTGKDNPDGAVAFAMERCERCHRAAPAAPAIAASPIARITVTAAFSHQTHQRYAAASSPGKDAPRPRAGSAEASCLPCHRALVEPPPPPAAPATSPAAPATSPAAAPAPPRLTPDAATCATAACHDGRAAFAITERCTQCHREAPATFYPVPRPTKRFVHRQHEAAIAAVGCQGCHRVEGAAGAVRGAGHAACASCHAADFGAAKPATCGACHSSTEPWRTLRADRLPWESTEFGARLDHARHAQPCQRCHTLDTATRQLRPTRDHGSCSGAGCHQLSGGAAPRLSECAECHQRDLVNERAELRLRLPWSVRRLFDHDRHRLGPTGATAECTSCHLAISGPLATMPAPPKRTCEPCHDGRKAFSVTGVDCNRCHGGAR